LIDTSPFICTIVILFAGDGGDMEGKEKKREKKTWVLSGKTFDLGRK